MEQEERPLALPVVSADRKQRPIEACGARNLAVGLEPARGRRGGSSLAICLLGARATSLASVGRRRAGLSGGLVGARAARYKWLN